MHINMHICTHTSIGNIKRTVECIFIGTFYDTYNSLSEAQVIQTTEEKRASERRRRRGRRKRRRRRRRIR